MNANIEHDLIVAEGTGAELSDEETDQVESLADKFDAEKMHERMMAEATKQAQKRLKKHRKEIERLKKHAEKCLAENNFFGYSYAIKKLRDIYKQPYTEDLIKSMWNTSRQALFDLVKEAQAQAK